MFWLKPGLLPYSVLPCTCVGLPIKVEAMMSYENALKETWSRLQWANERARNRDRQPEVLGAAFKIMICILVLLEVPWTMIGTIALAYTRRKAKSRSSPEWPADKIKRIARQGLALMSNLPDIIDDFNNPRIHMARKWLAECKLAMWCLQQNLKGHSSAHLISH